MTSPVLRRAAGLVAVGLALAVVCTSLGRWQWHRHVARDAAIAIVEQSWTADPVPLADVLAPGAALDPRDEWRRVTARGTYDAAAQVLLRNRPVDGQPGYHVLVPLVLADGGVLVVDRGWVPGEGDAVPEVPAAPAGEVEVTVRLRADETATDRTAPAGQVQAISVDQVLAAGGSPAAGSALHAYGGLVAESPAPATVLGTLPEPSTDPGSHLSYAFQWWVFAAGALVGFSVLARREVVDARRADDEDDVPTGDDAAPRAPLPQGARRAPRREGRAEAEEDALVDAWRSSPEER